MVLFASFLFAVFRVAPLCVDLQILTTNRTSPHRYGPSTVVRQRSFRVQWVHWIHKRRQGNGRLPICFGSHITTSLRLDGCIFFGQSGSSRALSGCACGASDVAYTELGRLRALLETRAKLQQTGSRLCWQGPWCLSPQQSTLVPWQAAGSRCAVFGCNIFDGR